MYGAGLIDEHNNVKVLPERMDLTAMCSFLAQHKPDCVIDATHPYATVVTQTVKRSLRFEQYGVSAACTPGGSWLRQCHSCA